MGTDVSKEHTAFIYRSILKMKKVRSCATAVPTYQNM